MIPSKMDTRRLVRPLVRNLSAYAPGEQPQIPGLVKLNTNENPYPPSPKVLRKVRKAVDGRLRLYPEPSATALRERLARRHECTSGHVIVGNGSDELLALAFRAFVEPAGKAGSSRATAQWLEPSYSLYPVLAEAHGARLGGAPLEADFSLPSLSNLRGSPRWTADAALTLVTTPNAPSGRGYSLRELDALCRSLKGVVVLDEAYVDFAPGDAMSMALKHRNVLVARTFSKGFSLCFVRGGYMVGDPALISALDAIRVSYNVNGLAQVAALATLDDLPYYRRIVRKITRTRERLGRELRTLGFEVLPSRTNFIMARPPRFSTQAWHTQLRRRKILVRWFDGLRVRSYLRITVGTDREINALIRAVRAILGERS